MLYERVYLLRLGQAGTRSLSAMSSYTFTPRRVTAALVAIAVTFCVHASWMSDLGITDTRGPAIVA